MLNRPFFEEDQCFVPVQEVAGTFSKSEAHRGEVDESISGVDVFGAAKTGKQPGFGIFGDLYEIRLVSVADCVVHGVKALASGVRVVG